MCSNRTFAAPVTTAASAALELDDIQFGMLHQRPASYVGTYLLLRIDNREAGRKLVQRLLPVIEPVRSSSDPARTAWVSVAFTYQGLKALGVPQDSLDSFAPEFRQGMAARAAELGDTGDSSPENWEKPEGGPRRAEPAGSEPGVTGVHADRRDARRGRGLAVRPVPLHRPGGKYCPQQLITGTILPSLKNAGIEVWPVGFGQADQGELSQFAGGGAQVNPNCPADTDATPRVTTVPSTVSGAAETQDIQQDLLEAFAAATCGTTSPPSWTTLGPGQSITKDVTIDPLTTLGSIVVNKGNPQVQVTYTDPDGGQVPDRTPSAGFLDGAAYTMTGGGSQLSQEALRLDNPVPGTWQVKFYNPLTVRQTVGVSVAWQGQVTPNVAFSPQIGVSGQLLQIQVTPTSGARPIPASELARLTVSLAVQWIPNGAVKHVFARLDPATGEFVGTVRVPGGQGHTTVTATVAEPGVQGTVAAEVSYDPTGGMNVALSFPRGIRVSPGGSLTETATADDLNQPATSLEFLLAGLGGGVVASIAQPDHPVAINSGRDQVTVTIHFGAQTRGEVLGAVQYEVPGSGVPITAAFLEVNVEPPSAMPCWVWAGLRLRRRRRRRPIPRRSR